MMQTFTDPNLLSAIEIYYQNTISPAIWELWEWLTFQLVESAFEALAVILIWNLIVLIAINLLYKFWDFINERYNFYQ